MAQGRRPGPLTSADDPFVSRHSHRAPTTGFSAAGPIGSSSWHHALKISNTAAKSPFAGWESIASLKDRTVVAVPAIRKRIQRWNEGSGAPDYWTGTLGYGKDVAARNTAYTSMWHQLEPDRGRYWFAAAGMVTGRGGIKDMDSSIVRIVGSVRQARDIAGLTDRFSGVVANVPTPDDIRFIVSGNAFLFPFNLHNFFTLRQRFEIPGFERLRGQNLDRALVVLEQTLVQQFIEAYSWLSKEDQDASLRRIGGGFFSSASNDFVRETLLSTCGRSFSFGSLDGRIQLGIALVAKLRERG